MMAPGAAAAATKAYETGSISAVGWASQVIRVPVVLKGIEVAGDAAAGYAMPEAPSNVYQFAGAAYGYKNVIKDGVAVVYDGFKKENIAPAILSTSTEANYDRFFCPSIAKDELNRDKK